MWSHCSSSCSQWALMFRVYTWDIHLGFSLSTWMTSALGGPGDFPVGWPMSRGRHSDYSFQIQMVTHRMHLKGSVERHASKNPPEFLLVLSEMQLLSLPHRDFFFLPVLRNTPALFPLQMVPFPFKQNMFLNTASYTATFTNPL